MNWSFLSTLGQGAKNAYNNARPALSKMGQGIKSWANTEFDQDNFNNPEDALTTGNKFRDMGIGALVGVNASEPSLYTMPTFNYAGNGLARIGYTKLDNPYAVGGIAQQLAGNLAKQRRAKGFNPSVNSNIGPDFANFNYNTSLDGTAGLYKNGELFRPFTLPQSDATKQAVNARFSWQ